MRIYILVLFLTLAGCGNTEIQKQRFLIRGNDALQQRSYREAVRFFEEAIALDSCYTAAINNLGIVYFEMGHYQKSVMEYGKALRCDPEYMDAYMNRSNVYFELNELFRSLD